MTMTHVQWIGNDGPDNWWSNFQTLFSKIKTIDSKILDLEQYNQGSHWYNELMKKNCTMNNKGTF
jgi:hypothetical protein